MRSSSCRRFAAFAAALISCVLIALASVPWVQAQTRIAIGGAGPLYYPRVISALPFGRMYFFGTSQVSGPPLPFLEAYDLLNHMVAENWYPGTTPQVVNYPASMGILSGSLAAPGVNVGVEMGRVSLDDQIKNAAAGGDPVVIGALSEGTLVINRELAHLATDPKAPRPELLSFAMFASPETGLFRIYLPVHTRLPIVNYTSQDLAESQYDVSVVFHQYDFWSDPPDRPWNLLADLNSLAGLAYFHDGTAMVAPSDAIELSSVTSHLGGTTTTYMVPAPTLPLLLPLQQIGVPARIVNALNGVLKPIVDKGYSRLTPQAGPYFLHGRLVRPAHSSAPARAARSAAPVRAASNAAGFGLRRHPPRTSGARHAPPSVSSAGSRGASGRGQSE